jgi:hypothetical protein
VLLFAQRGNQGDLAETAAAGSGASG